MHTLIADLEQAESGRRELDKGIALELGWTQKVPSSYWRSPDGEQHADLPRYTTSISDAETVVLANCGWFLESNGTASVHSLKQEPNQIGYLVIGEAQGATPALGLVIAALKARQAVKEQDDG